MTKEEFKQSLIRINPYITFDGIFINVPDRDEYSFFLEDETFTIEHFYGERQCSVTEYRYDEIETEEDIPPVFGKSDFLKLRDTLITRMGHINHPAITNRIKALQEMSNINQLLEEILIKDKFYLSVEVLNETVIKNIPNPFGKEIKFGVLYNDRFHTYIVYDGEPLLTAEYYKNVIALGNTKPNIIGGQIIRCFGKSIATVITEGYVEVYSEEAYAAGKAKAVSSVSPDIIDFRPPTFIIKNSLTE